MALDLPTIDAASKTLILTSGWSEDAQGRQSMFLSMDIDGATVEGLTLRLVARRSLPDRHVMCQLEYRPPFQIVEPFCRIDWRPLKPHNNHGRGPEEYRFREMTGSHHHPFGLNWDAQRNQMLKENLPIGVPIDPDPSGFRQLLALVSKEFRITNAEEVPLPSWDMML
jgi:hypothetical protein